MSSDDDVMSRRMNKMADAMSPLRQPHETETSPEGLLAPGTRIVVEIPGRPNVLGILRGFMSVPAPCLIIDTYGNGRVVLFVGIGVTVRHPPPVD